MEKIKIIGRRRIKVESENNHIYLRISMLDRAPFANLKLERSEAKKLAEQILVVLGEKEG